MREESLSARDVVVIAAPIVVANVAVPLLGVADTAVIGHLGRTAPLAAIAIGAQIFNFLYWGMGFLRMGTTGLAAQARGGGDEGEVRAVLLRALLVAGVIGGALILFQRPLVDGALLVFPSNREVAALVRQYVLVRIWDAPAVLATYAAIGWFIGRKETRVVMLLQVFMNTLNIALDVALVVGFGLGVRGVAVGTLVAEWSALGLAGVLITMRLRRARAPRAPLLEPRRFSAMLQVNRDIFLRTVLLIAAFAWFTRQGARSGEVVLAANHVLLQFLAFSSFFLDGFAFAAEALVGQAFGSGSRGAVTRAVRLSTVLAVGTAAAMSLGFAVLGPFIIDGLTNVPAVRATARVFLWYAALHPLLGVWCFQLDGIFIGATRTRDMRNAMVLSFLLYLGAWWLAWGPLGNHGLWLAFLVFFVARGVTLGARYPALVEAVRPPRGARVPGAEGAL